MHPYHDRKFRVALQSWRPDVEIQAIFANLQVRVIVARTAEGFGHVTIPIENPHSLHASSGEPRCLTTLNFGLQGLRCAPAEVSDRRLRERHAEKSGDIAIFDELADEHLAVDLGCRSSRRGGAAAGTCMGQCNCEQDVTHD